jgi:hypothetical protein
MVRARYRHAVLFFHGGREGEFCFEFARSNWILELASGCVQLLNATGIRREGVGWVKDKWVVFYSLIVVP